MQRNVTRASVWIQIWLSIVTLIGIGFTELTSQSWGSEDKMLLTQPPIWGITLDPSWEIRPMWAHSFGLSGLASLDQIAQQHGAKMGINAGFFNRNTGYPIGALRQQGRWISSPILGRGAMAWDNQGHFLFARLHLRGQLSTSSGLTLPLAGINTAFPTEGIVQITPDWGSVYQLAEEETVVEVNHTQVTAIYPGIAGSPISIPAAGYLLIERGQNGAIQPLEIGSDLTLEFLLDPPDLNAYPYVVGAGPLLIQQGQIVLDPELEGFKPDFAKQPAARSVICQLKTGQIWLGVMGNSETGVTLSDLAERLKTWGCQEALNLDGGSSATLYQQGRIVNGPADSTWIPRIHNGLGVFDSNLDRL